MTSESEHAVVAAGLGQVTYTYNVYSETMGAYVLAADSAARSAVLDVPDGPMRLELYQARVPRCSDGRWR